MKDKRILVFKKSLEDLVESLDATLALAGLDDEDAAPAPVRESASRLPRLLGTTDRLAAGVFKGNPRSAAEVTELTGAMRRLADAYIAYRRELESTASTDSASAQLAATLEQVKTRTLSAHD